MVDFSIARKWMFPVSHNWGGVTLPVVFKLAPRPRSSQKMTHYL